MKTEEVMLIDDSHEPIRFAEPTDGSAQIAALCRASILRYVVPSCVALVFAYLGIKTMFGQQVSPTVFLLLATSATAFGLKKLDKTKQAVAAFMIGAFFTLSLYCLPVLGQPNGLLCGSAYSFSLFPLIVWVCYASRFTRISILSLTFLVLLGIAVIGDPNAEAAQPDLLWLGFMRCVFLIAVSIGIASVYDGAVSRQTKGYKKSIAEQEELNLQLANQRRDLERAATAHHQTLLHLGRSESKYRMMFSHAFDGIVIYNSALDQIVEVNKTFCERLKYSEKDILTKNALALSPKKQRDGRLSSEVQNQLSSKLDTGEDLAYEWTFETKTGVPVHFDVSTFCLATEKDLRISVFRDTSDIIAAQQKMETVNRDLRTFAHAASHDLKEPLRTMSNFAKLLKRRYAEALDDTGVEYLDFIMDAGLRGTQLVKDLLYYAEVGNEVIETKIIDMNIAAADVQRSVVARLEQEGASLKIGHLPEIRATPTWAVQLLQNMVSNALKFSRPGVPPVVEVSSSSSLLGHEIYIKDNGIGIAPENLDRIFGVFERLVHRDKYEGSGIGLALCQRIVRKLEGDIRVHSKLGEGTTFTIWFPSTEDFTIPVSEIKTESASIKV